MENIDTFKELEALVPSIMLALIIFLFGLEFFLNSNDIKGDTFKVRMRKWVYGKSFYLTFIWGALTGHFFLGASEPIIKKMEWGIGAIVVTAVILLFIGRKIKVKINAKHQLILLISGILFGHFFFSMNSN